MKRIKFFLPALAVLLAVVGAFASESLVADTYSYKPDGINCDAFQDCTATSGVNCANITIYNNTTCATGTTSLTGFVRQ